MAILPVIRSYLSPWQATSSDRHSLSSQPRPVLDPLAQDYAAWRMRSLRRSCLAVALSYALDVYAGGTVATVKFGLRHPTSLEAWLEAGLSWYLRLVVVVCCRLVLYATLCWKRLDRSSFLARSAGVIAFLGPMPLFLIPFPRVLEQHGVDAMLLASNVIRGVLTLYVPELFALLPALIRASIVLKRFLPESVVPGLLVVVATPLQSLLYFLLICILVQIVPHRDFVLGMLCLALAPLVWLARAKAIIRPISAQQGENPLRYESLVNVGLTLIGSLLILLEVSEDVELDLLIFRNVDVYQVLRLMAGVLASRALLTVILVDGMLAILFHSSRAEQAGTPAETAERLKGKIRVLGEALTDGGPIVMSCDGRTDEPRSGARL